MNTVVRALIWELLWKNRVIVAALGVLLGLGAGLAQASHLAGPEAGWTGQARAFVGVMFFTSVLLSLALFTLMDSHEGSRMNSMVARWFVLPVPTWLLVLLPMVTSALFLTVVLAAWIPVLERALGRADLTGMQAAALISVLALQTLAWALPRKPPLFWMAASLFVPVSFLVAMLAQDSPEWPARRERWLQFAAALVLALIAGAYVAARHNRHGGRLTGLPRLIRTLGSAGPDASATDATRHTGRAWFPGPAPFQAELLPRIRAFAVGWLVFALLITSVMLLPFAFKRSNISFSPRLLAFIAVDFLPALGVIWLGLWGMLAGCERGAGFRTQLTSFRATLPVSIGTLTAERLLALTSGWLLVWLPLLAALPFYSPDLVSHPTAETIRTGAARLSWHMAISAHVLVGALPLLLWGRLTGFPNVLLAAVGGAAFTCYLCGWLRPGDPPVHPWTMLGVLFFLKFAAASWGLVTSLRSGHIRWRFALLLPAAWIVLTAALIWILPVWQTGDAWRVASIALLMPLARLAWCPAALAANRHR